MSADEAIRATNDDAAGCKRFAIEKGYWKDPYIHYFLPKSERKAPEISRGYFARVAGISTLLNEFLKKTQCQCQIVNLGAGFDTLYWRLKEENQSPTCIVDVDFGQVVSRKCNIIKKSHALLDSLKVEGCPDVVFSEHEMHAGNYHILAQDLRDLTGFENRLRSINFDFNLPTAFISECVLVYMPVDSSNKLLKWVADRFATAMIINYEQTNMNDHFGRIMIDNLKHRGCTLPGVEACTSLESQQNRFLFTGWNSAKAWNMQTVYQSLPKQEISRIERLEFLDERELLVQLLEHYCISVATKETDGLGLSSITLPVNVVA